MIKIDGSQKSGSGTIVRYAVGLAALLGQDLEITNIRARRDRPGLRIQHLAAINALAELCGGQVEGGTVGSSRLVFRPGKPVVGGHFAWDIGTAGSATMLALTLLPMACVVHSNLTCSISGGLFQDRAPSAFHMQYVLLPTLQKMGLRSSLDIVRPGYIPTGHGTVDLKLDPLEGRLTVLDVTDQGNITGIEGIALSSHLEERKVSDRMADECQKVLQNAGYAASIKVVYDSTASQSGAAMALFAHTDSGVIIGADGIGALGRTSERVGKNTAKRLIQDLSAKATVDRFLGDQLIFYAALALGTTRYRIPQLTEHVETNLWLVENMLGAKHTIDQDLLLQIDGVGLF